MMSHRGKIEGINSNDISLEKSLRPVWKASYYSCVLMDWCQRLPNKRRASLIAHFIGISSCLTVMVISFVFLLYQLIKEASKKDNSFHSIIPNLMWFCNYPLDLTTAFGFLSLRRDLLSFFEDWSRLEKQLLFVPQHCIKTSKKIYRFAYAAYVIHTTVVATGAVFIMLNRLEASYLLSHYATLRDAVTVPGVIIFHTTSIIIGGLLVTMSDLVPAWTFYHAGIALQSLALEVEQFFTKPFALLEKNCTGLVIRQVLRRYETVVRLTERANDLFSLWIAVGHVALFFMICALAYTVMSRIKNAEFEVFLYAMGLVFFIVRLAAPILMTSYVGSSYIRLKVVLSMALTNDTLDREDRHRMKALLCRVKESPLAARPFNLYEISRSTLLTMTSLIVSYVIILLQSDGGSRM